MKLIVAKLAGLLTRRRLVYSGGTLLIGLLGYFGYSFSGGPWWQASDSPVLRATARPDEILSGMTDDELLAFATQQQLPESLRSDDWVRVDVISGSLNERLPAELVKRWQRDAVGVTAYNATAAHQVSTMAAPQLDVSQPGVLGVQVVAQGSGLQVTYIHPNSAAVRCGLRVGDQILAINQRRVFAPDDLVQQLHRAMGAGGGAQIEFVRGYTRQIATADVSGGAHHVASHWQRRY